jgi:hypothetical protein
MTTPKPFDSDEQKPVKMIKVELVGKNPRLWQKLHRLLFEKIDQLLEYPLDPKQGATLGDELNGLALGLAD